MAKTTYFKQDLEIENFNDEGEPEQYFLSAKEQEKVLRQIEKEYELCKSYNDAKRKIMLARLKLYNNQRRNQDAVGDPLMFTVFNTIHAALYDDRLMANWEGRGGEGDEDVEENLNALSEYDYDLMEKSQLDYNWNWDAEFFGRGLVLMMDFERSKPYQCPIPEYIPAISWIRDPRATSVNGDMRGRGAMRFGGREIGLSYWEMKDMPAYFNLNLLKKDKEINSLVDELREAHRDAQGLENFKDKEESLDKKGNYEFRLIEWFTHYKGKKYLFTLANSRKLLVRYQAIKDTKWPISDRALYPMSSDWDGVSIPDLTEDKQRARAILLNIGLKSAKADVIPTYLFDSNKITNRNDLNFKTNKFIPVKGDVSNAMMPAQKSAVHQYVTLIMDVLDSAAQRATATPEIQQGVPSADKRTLGELNLVSSKVDTRYSMSAKIYGWSERTFWLQWYKLYKRYFKDEIDEKVVRIQGALAPIWRPLTRDNIIAEVDPDVKIESKIISEAKRVRDQQSYSQFAGLALQEPTANRRYILKHLAKLNGLKKEQIDSAFPKTIPEMQAEDENEQLNAEKLPKIDVRDDHLIHIDIHSKANQNAQSIAHIRAHKKLMILKQTRPDLFPPEQAPQFKVPGQPSLGAPKVAGGAPPSTPTQ